MVTHTCRLCKQNTDPVLSLGDHPIAHRFLAKENESEFTHPVNLSYCRHCGLLQLVDPIRPEEMYSEYNWLSSWKPNPQIPGILNLIKKMDRIDENSRIVEIGSNDGSFLNELKKKGYSNLLGIEPSRDGYEAATEKGIPTVHDYFDADLANSIVTESGRCDLIICRHALEHIQDLDQFSRGISHLLNPGGFILVEVPDTDFILDNMDYTQIWEEHVNYFTMLTLEHYLEGMGIRKLSCSTALFSGQALIFAGKMEPSKKAAPTLFKTQNKKVRYFKDFWPLFKSGFSSYLAVSRNQGKKIAVYGAGCRACSLINFTGISNHLEFVVDDQPEKTGLFLAGSRLPVYESLALVEKQIDICLLAVNAENNEKVEKKHTRFINSGGCFVPILPPSDRLPEFWKRR